MKNAIAYMRVLLIVTISILWATSCSKTAKNTEFNEPMTIGESISYTSPHDTLPSSMLASINWIPLESSDMNAIREISKLIVFDGKVILGDKRLGSIHAYDFSSGKLLYIIDQKGNGPDEYLETAAFTATPTSIYVLDNYSHAIFRYSSADGSFIEKKTISFVAWDMEAYNDDAFLFSWLSNNPDAPKPSSVIDYAVWQTNGNFNITETYLPLQDDDVEMYGKTLYFTRHDGDIIFHALKYHGYFSFAENQPPIFHPIEFTNPIPTDKSLRLKDLENTSWQYLGETPFISNDFAVVEITEGDFGQQMFETGGKIFANSTDWAATIPINIIGVTDGNRFIGYLNDNYELYEELVAHGFRKGSEDAESLLRQGGCCLIVYTLKK